MNQQKKISSYLDPAWVRVFDIPGFSDRMALIRGEIRPGLVALASDLSRLLSGGVRDFWPHVASHMRRRVNPPPETWLALGPEKRGYKAYAHSGVFIGSRGLSVRFVLKDEAEHERRYLGEWLQHHEPEFSRWMRQVPGLLDFGPVHGRPDREPERFSQEGAVLGKRLAGLKTASLDVGFPTDFSASLDDLVGLIRSFDPLYMAAKGS